MQPPPPTFDAGLERIGLSLEKRDLDRLGAFLQILLDANERVNLTAVTDPAEAWVRHVLDSLTLEGHLADSKSVVDVGSGGGLPAFPLAIVRPDVSFTLVEAIGKKATFLEEAAARLELPNVTVVRDRAENAAAPSSPHREAYDVAIARAVAPLRVLLELTLPFVRTGGKLLAIKGAKAEVEIAEAKSALRKLHARVAGTSRTETGTLVIVAKDQPTPARYPRRPGEPKRAPL